MTWASTTGYFSADPTVNPLMYNWSMIYLPYCDGGSQTGNLAAPVTVGAQTIYYRGKRILDAMQAALLGNATVGLSAATDVVVSGCSAGGLSTFLHTDSWRAALPSATLVGMPDSGFFLRYNATAHNPTIPLSYEDLMRWVYARMNASAFDFAPACAAVNGADPARCIFAEGVSPTLAAPFFPLQSEYDSWQVGNDLDVKPTDNAAIQTYGDDLVKRYTRDLVGNPAGVPHAGTVDSCFHHCGSAAWNSYSFGSLTQATAFGAWYSAIKAGTAAPKALFQKKAYPCTACCVPAA